MSLGVVEYISLIAINIPAIIYGYNVYFSQYNNREYISIIPLYLSYASIFYKATLGIAIAWATYVSFIKNRK